MPLHDNQIEQALDPLTPWLLTHTLTIRTMTKGVWQMVGIVLRAPQHRGLGALASPAEGPNLFAQHQVIVCCASESAHKEISVRAAGFMSFFRRHWTCNLRSKRCLPTKAKHVPKGPKVVERVMQRMAAKMAANM
eukprot:2677585-Karenia_brevis.AAC.1